MKTRLFVIAACLTLLVSMMALPAFAAEAHSDSTIRWSIDGVEHYMAPIWVSTARTAPMYVTWDDGLCVLLDTADTGGNVPGLFYKRVEGGTYNWMTEGTLVELENKSYYQFRLSNDNIRGLDITSCKAFFESLSDGSTCYYLESPDADWSTAITSDEYLDGFGFMSVVDDIGTLFAAAIGFVATVATTVTGNPILLLFAVLSLVGLGVGLFVRMKNVGR